METGYSHLIFKTDYRENRWQASVLNENNNQAVHIGRYSTYQKMVELAPRRLKYMMEHTEAHIKTILWEGVN